MKKQIISNIKHQTSIADKYEYYCSMIYDAKDLNSATPQTARAFKIYTRHLNKLGDIYNVEAIELIACRFVHTVITLGKNIASYMPKLKVIFFNSKFKDQLKFRKDIISILPQLEIIVPQSLDLSKKHKKTCPDQMSVDEFFLAWRIIKGNLEGIITDKIELLSDAQEFLKDADHLSINQILAKLPQELVEFVPEIIVGSPVLSPNLLETLDQLKTIDLSGRVLDKSHDKLFLTWRIIKGNLEGLITDDTTLTDVQKFLKDSDLLDINKLLKELPQELVKFVPEIIVGSPVLSPNLFQTLDQLKTIDLSGRVLDKSHDKLFLTWLMIKGKLEGITTDGSKLSDAQKFLKEYDDFLEGSNLTKKEPDELKIKKILEKIEADYADYKDLFQLMEETFQIGLWRNIIKKLDQNLTLIEADPNSSKFKKLPIDLNKQLVKAISILPAKDISFLTISSLSKTKIPLSWFLSNTKIENTQITNLNNEPGQFAAFVRNMLLANVFDGNVIKSKSVAHKKQLELFNKLKKTGSVYESLHKYLKLSDWLSYIERLKTKQQEEVRQMFQPQEEVRQMFQPQDEEISQQVAGDNAMDRNTSGEQNTAYNDLD